MTQASDDTTAPWRQRLVRAANPLVAALLRSPLHGIASRNILLLTFRGRSSGREYTTPLSYIRDGDRVRCFTKSPWWRNLQQKSEVVTLLRGQRRSGQAVAVAGPDRRVQEGLREMVARVPRDARYYGIHLERDGRPDPEDLAAAAERSVMIDISLD